MSDYIPTTEEVRSYYRGSSATRGEDFDRWLAEVKAEAWEEGWKDSLALAHFADNPYRIIISANDYD